MISRNDPCWCGSQKKWKKCHFPIKSEDRSSEYKKKYGIILKTQEQIAKIRESSQVAAFILDKLCQAAQEGITTNELDRLARELHKKSKAIPAPLGYGHPPFPKSICTSLNEVICHGIPDDRPLQKGDIINIDVTSIVDGYYGDCSRMVMIGEVSEEKKRVVEVSYQCLMRSIEICCPGTKILEIGNLIESYAHQHGCSVVNQFVGHGVGLFFHEPPQIPHHYNHMNIEMIPGMVFTIEPMINAGMREAVIDPHDQWTARTKDGLPSAQWEHTIVITENGHEILTQIV
ncbi:MAG: methionyl aminopeptidase [Parachlamydiales bacterium]|nr:methionyl aminopeptidase [Parachlamydiales bacterium]